MPIETKPHVTGLLAELTIEDLEQWQIVELLERVFSHPIR